MSNTIVVSVVFGNCKEQMHDTNKELYRKTKISPIFALNNQNVIPCKSWFPVILIEIWYKSENFSY